MQKVVRMAALFTVHSGVALALQPRTVELADFHVPSASAFLGGLKKGCPAFESVRRALAAQNEAAGTGVTGRGLAARRAVRRRAV